MMDCIWLLCTLYTLIHTYISELLKYPLYAPIECHVSSAGGWPRVGEEARRHRSAAVFLPTGVAVHSFIRSFMPPAGVLPVQPAQTHRALSPLERGSPHDIRGSQGGFREQAHTHTRTHAHTHTHTHTLFTFNLNQEALSNLSTAGYLFTFKFLWIHRICIFTSRGILFQIHC